jgi:hypothetical protein
MLSGPHRRSLCFTYIQNSSFASFYTFPPTTLYHAGVPVACCTTFAATPTCVISFGWNAAQCAMMGVRAWGISILECLRILENREEAWATLDFRRSVKIPMPFNSTSTYDFAGGALSLGTSTRLEPSHWHADDDRSTNRVLLPSPSVALGFAESKIGGGRDLALERRFWTLRSRRTTRRST